MSAGKYWLLTFLAVVIAALILLEIVCENQVAILTAEVTYNQTRVVQAQQQVPLLRQLVQRLAIEGQHDPALMDILTKRGLKVTPAAETGAPSLPEGASDLLSNPKSSPAQ